MSQSEKQGSLPAKGVVPVAGGKVRKNFVIGCVRFHPPEKLGASGMIPRYEVATPEGVSFHFVLAGPAPRALAWLIDSVIQCTAGFILMLVLFMVVAQTGFVFAFLMPLLLFLLNWGYHIYFDALQGGQTIGKKLLKLRVLSNDGLPVGFHQSVLRNLLRIADGLPGGIGAYLIAQRSPEYAVVGFFCGYLLGVIIMFFGSGQRRLGDWAGGTIVVCLEKSEPPASVTSAERRANPLRANAELCGRLRRQITPREKRLLNSLCLRRDELELGPRAALFRRFAAHFRKRFPLLHDFSVGDEKTVIFLADVLA